MDQPDYVLNINYKKRDGTFSVSPSIRKRGGGFFDADFALHQPDFWRLPPYLLNDRRLVHDIRQAVYGPSQTIPGMPECVDFILGNPEDIPSHNKTYKELAFSFDTLIRNRVLKTIQKDPSTGSVKSYMYYMPDLDSTSGPVLFHMSGITLPKLPEIPRNTILGLSELTFGIFEFTPHRKYAMPAPYRIALAIRQLIVITGAFYHPLEQLQAMTQRELSRFAKNRIKVHYKAQLVFADAQHMDDRMKYARSCLHKLFQSNLEYMGHEALIRYLKAVNSQAQPDNPIFSSVALVLHTSRVRYEYYTETLVPLFNSALSA